MLLKVSNPPITFTQGDDVSLIFTATNNQGSPVNLTGATFSTEINGPNTLGPVTFGNSQHTANADQVNFTGQFTLALTAANTNACGIGANKEIVTEITISAKNTFFIGPDILTVLPEAPFP